jgi:CarD family transcriptional regulator
VFDIGEMAVYPAHGVGVIESIEQRSVGETEQSFYVMKILNNNMVIMIPTATSKNVGLRSIISSNEVDDVFDILQEKDVEIGSQTWNRRYREYMEKIKTGSVFEVAAVLRDLYLLQEDKDLSYGERKMMDTAKGLLVKELSIAKQTEEDQVEEIIEQIFAS